MITELYILQLHTLHSYKLESVFTMFTKTKTDTFLPTYYTED